MNPFDASLARAAATLERLAQLNDLYRAGLMHAHVPAALGDSERSLDALVEQHLPASHAALQGASRGLFFSLPVAFDPAESVGPYLAAIDRDAADQPYRFLDMGALIATQAFGENEPAVVSAVLESLPFVTTRYAHSEYQTVLSLRLKAELNRIAPAGSPRHFIVNTGAESVENAIKSVLLNRVMTSPDGDGGFIVSFDGAFHGRTLGALAVTHRKKARLGFPTFDWPHIPFPVEEIRSPKETARREERSLKQLWDLLVSGRLPGAEKNKETFRREIDAMDAFLEVPGVPGVHERVNAFVQEQRANLTPDVVRRARRVAAVLVEPIQGEGGVRMASARFMRRLRLLTRIYDVPLVFDEVQTGWGMTGRLWAHELFDLPCPPDVVTWAKKAQNGVLFVSEELATFFQEEKKFNTTWEGDSVGMVRLLALLDKLDLEQVRRTGERARAGLEALAREHREIIRNVRGAGVMLGFDVMRPDWCEALRDRAFRRGLILLAAGERCVRFYPRYDTEPSAIDEALSILRLAIEDLAGAANPALPATGPKTRVGMLSIPLDTVEIVDLTPAVFEACRLQVLAVEQERYGTPAAPYPPDALKHGRRPPLLLPLETLEATVSQPGAVGVAARDRVSNRLVAYALGSALENHDEEGVSSDPHFGENNTFYLQAMAALPAVQNAPEIENVLLDALREKVLAAGFEFFSTLIEERLAETGPPWLRDAIVIDRIENYLGSGSPFAYLQAALKS